MSRLRAPIRMTGRFAPRLAFVVLLLSLTVAVVVTVAADAASVPKSSPPSPPRTQAEWYAHGRAAIEAVERQRHHRGRARNVLLFVGDGMDVNTQTAARIYEADSAFAGQLEWQRFPHVALLRTWCPGSLVCDSAATANALFSGVKTPRRLMGVDGSVEVGQCARSLVAEAHLESLVARAQRAGMRTGFVTNTRVSHATPGALYARAADRGWECEERMPEEAKRAGCLDIARQLIDGPIGRRLNVIMGGGRQQLVANLNATEREPIDSWSCYSRDGRNLIESWRQRHAAAGHRHHVAHNTGDLLSARTAAADYVLGIFANAHLSYEFERDTTADGMPSLEQMTRQAIRVLERGAAAAAAAEATGWLLVVEGGMIDMAHHRGWARIALDETVALSRAVRAALAEVREAETLVVVTSDHGLTLSMNGYPSTPPPAAGAGAASNDVDGGGRAQLLGVAQRSRDDGVPYTTLTYGTGGPQAWQVRVDAAGRPVRVDPSGEDTTAFRYGQQAGVRTDEVTHSGADQVAYARGPGARLFAGVQEQTYVAHAVAEAAALGCERRGEGWEERCLGEM